MFRQLAVIALVVACAFAAPIENYDDIPAEYKGLIPSEVAEVLKSFTPEDKATFKEIYAIHKEIKDEEQFLNVLKEKSPSLHEKALKLRTFVQTKVDALGDEAKEFVTKALGDVKKIHAQYLAGEKISLEQLKEVAKKHVGDFQKLSAGAKEEFKTQFPILTGVFSNPSVQALVDKHLN